MKKIKIICRKCIENTDKSINFKEWYQFFKDYPVCEDCQYILEYTVMNKKKGENNE